MSVKLLCTLATAKKNRYYIPGETASTDQMRKTAFDYGLYSTLTYIFHQTSGRDDLKPLRDLIKRQVLNIMELSDLNYHVKVIESIINGKGKIDEEPDTTAASNKENVSNSGRAQTEPTPVK